MRLLRRAADLLATGTSPLSDAELEQLLTAVRDPEVVLPLVEAEMGRLGAMRQVLFFEMVLCQS